MRDQVTVTDSEINNMLTSPTYKAGEIHLAHIQVSLPAGASAADIKAAQAKAEQAINAIKGGMDFHAAAIRYSDAQDALEGGDLGWRRMDEVPPAFADAVANMKAGDVSARPARPDRLPHPQADRAARTEPPDGDRVPCPPDPDQAQRVC